MASSLARAPYCTVTDWSTRAVAVARAEPGPDSPVYQLIVFAGVPLTSAVAVPNGEPATRSGGTVAGAVAPRPSAANAAEFELVTVRLVVLLLLSTMPPGPTVDAAVVRVIESIFANSVLTESVTLSWLPTAPEATNVIGVPLTVMVLPATKLAASGFVPATPANRVAPVIGAGVAAWLLTALPATCSGGGAGADGGALKPSPGKAAEFVLVMVRFVVLLLRRVATPALTVEGIEVLVIESIFASSVWTRSVTLTWFPVAPEATNVIGVPFTVMLSPAMKLLVSES